MNTGFPFTLSFILCVLAGGSIFINGWTDAVNAIATCVGSGALSFRKAAFLAAVFNFFGVLSAALLGNRASRQIYGIITPQENPQLEILILCASLIAVILWGAATWWVGIPSSESHALVAGISGAAVSLSFSALDFSNWILTIGGMAAALLAGFVSGSLTLSLLEKIWPGKGRAASLRIGQIAAAALMAFAHGAQDGQKFIAAFLLGFSSLLPSHSAFSKCTFLLLLFLCALLMACGTAVGGRRIVNTIGKELVPLDMKKGFAADLAGGFSLFLLTFCGIPASTTHAKVAAVIGVGFSPGKPGSFNRPLLFELFCAWLITFPVCGLLGYSLCSFLRIAFC